MKINRCPTLFFALFLIPVHAAEPRKPNILFIAIDDQNDWIGHLGGHPMVKTPHLDRLAVRGTTFLNAHCNSPLCNPRAPASCQACGPLASAASSRPSCWTSIRRSSSSPAIPPAPISKEGNPVKRTDPIPQ